MSVRVCVRTSQDSRPPSRNILTNYTNTGHSPWSTRVIQVDTGWRCVYTSQVHLRKNRVCMLEARNNANSQTTSELHISRQRTDGQTNTSLGPATHGAPVKPASQTRELRRQTVKVRLTVVSLFVYGVELLFLERDMVC